MLNILQAQRRRRIPRSTVRSPNRISQTSSHAGDDRLFVRFRSNAIHREPRQRQSTSRTLPHPRARIASTALRARSRADAAHHRDRRRSSPVVEHYELLLVRGNWTFA